MKNLDVLFVNPNGSKKIYQELSNKYSAIETPTWSLLLAESCRSVGYEVGILDTCAENLSDEESVERIKVLNPKLLCFAVYGQNVNAGTVNMHGATRLSKAIKNAGFKNTICFVGSHMSALPYEVLEKEKSIDVILTNDGVYALRNLLALDSYSIQNLETIKGIGFIKDGEPFLTAAEKPVPQQRMDEDLPGYAWDLLPYKEKPLDLYRSPMWHANYVEEERSPYAALYTSLGCMFKCSFCMINVVNRDNNDKIGIASNYSGMRYWSPEFIVREFDKLVKLGVKTIRICDEMFLLNKKYYIPLCKMLKERGYGDFLNMWAYSRIDTVKDPENLKLVREAGIKWLCLGIESGDRNVRLEASKGKFKDVDISHIIDMIHKADIDIMANYLVGLPGDTHDTMQRTLDLSYELCTRGWNMYAAMALPGSQLYADALSSGHSLPDNYADYSFHSYETEPLPTEDLTPAEILKFRDEAWTKYHTYEPFLNLVEEKSGPKAKQDIVEMTKIKLKRKILGD
jgi:anaerobic magnesium-protoporphyrin IX monomethyl ester cyclase